MKIMFIVLKKIKKSIMSINYKEKVYKLFFYFEDNNYKDYNDR